MDIKIILVLIVLAITLIFAIYKFINLSKEKKIENLKQWLKWAVIEAEKTLGSGTGQLKLRKVYDMAARQFPWIVTFISFDMFSAWVDEALIWMHEQIESNEAIQNYTMKP